MRLLPSGSTAILVEADGLPEVMRLVAALEAHPLPGVVDIVPAARTILVVIDRRRTSLADTVTALRAIRPQVPDRPTGGGLVEIPTRYDGPDLADVADHLGWTAAEVIRWHGGQDWIVAFCGFSPGFGYLVASDRQAAVPRRSSPRATVPAGAVGLGGEFTGVYPRASPGGWQLIGHTGAAVFDPDRDPAALFRPGTRVRFVAAGGDG